MMEKNIGDVVGRAIIKGMYYTSYPILVPLEHLAALFSTGLSAAIAHNFLSVGKVIIKNYEHDDTLKQKLKDFGYLNLYKVLYNDIHEYMKRKGFGF